MKPAVGERIELEVTKVVHGGLGLARHGGFVVFVRGALPRERVVAEVVDVKKNHSFAELVDVLTPSSMRVPHVWPEAEYTRPTRERAGGADFGHIELAYQRALKAEVLRDALTRFGKLQGLLVDNVTVDPLPGDQDGLHWRTRVGLHVNQQGQAGPFVEGSHTVVPVKSLPLAAKEIEDLSVHRADWSGHSKLRIVKPSLGEPRLIIDDQAPDTIVESAGGFEFRLSDQGFWQVHSAAANRLFSEVVSRASSINTSPGSVHWDLYGGVGLFSRALAEGLGSDESIISVETDAAASDYATANLSDLAGFSAYASDTLRFLRQPPARSGPLGVVVLDPPRSGANREVISLLSQQKPAGVIYVACDPVALARDIAIFAEHGYDVGDIQGLDMFPHTHHIEAVATLLPAN